MNKNLFVWRVSIKFVLKLLMTKQKKLYLQIFHSSNSDSFFLNTVMTDDESNHEKKMGDHRSAFIWLKGTFTIVETFNML